jgi:hypothetical protein
MTRTKTTTPGRLHWQQIIAAAPDAYTAVKYAHNGDLIDVPAHPELRHARITGIHVDYQHQPDPVMVEYASGEDGHHYTGVFSTAPAALPALIHPAHGEAAA